MPRVDPSAQFHAGQSAVRSDGDGVQVPHRPSLDTHPSSDNKDAVDTGDPHEDADQSLHTEVTQLRRAMETRPTIDQACGVLMATFGLSPEAAWDVLVATSQNTNTKLNRLAGDVVGTAQGDALPKAIRDQLTAAIAKVNATPVTPDATA
jgi:hypothetical protein